MSSMMKGVQVLWILFKGKVFKKSRARTQRPKGDREKIVEMLCQSSEYYAQKYQPQMAYNKHNGWIKKSGLLLFITCIVAGGFISAAHSWNDPHWLLGQVLGLTIAIGLLVFAVVGLGYDLLTQVIKGGHTQALIFAGATLITLPVVLVIIFVTISLNSQWVQWLMVDGSFKTVMKWAVGSLWGFGLGAWGVKAWEARWTSYLDAGMDYSENLNSIEQRLLSGLGLPGEQAKFIALREQEELRKIAEHSKTDPSIKQSNDSTQKSLRL